MTKQDLEKMCVTIYLTQEITEDLRDLAMVRGQTVSLCAERLLLQALLAARLEDTRKAKP